MIEPNAHPLIVHFVIAFLMTAPLAYIVSAILPERAAASKAALRAAGDWMLALGIAAAAFAVLAGFNAYYSVAHDGPSHAAMTDHRNFALLTAGLFAAFGVWRLAGRRRAPSLVFAVLLLVPATLLAATGWKGGRLVYHHGLGVASLPNATGEGHDHEHEGDHEHAVADDHDEADHHPVADEAGAARPEEPATAADADLSTPVAVVDAFGAALKSGDAAAIERLLAPDVLIAESGGAERSFAEYRSHHMPADMEYSKAVPARIEDRRIYESGDIAVVVTSSAMHGAFRGAKVHSRLMETMTLTRSASGWRIVHIHWSSAPMTGEHEH